MPRPPSVAGGRPNQVTVRFSDSELDALDKRRESLNRADYLRRMALDTPTVSQRRELENPGGGDHMSDHQIDPAAARAARLLGAQPSTSGAVTYITGQDTPEDIHAGQHDWHKFSQYLDRCPECGAERPHQTGTR